MSDPNQHHDEKDELDLDAEAVKDLEPSADETEAIRGGGKVTLFDCLPSMGCTKGV